LDDAVLSCAALIAGHASATVATVFAGAPHAFDASTEWDAASDFEVPRTPSRDDVKKIMRR